jgi:hypothetical protein
LKDVGALAYISVSLSLQLSLHTHKKEIWPIRLKGIVLKIKVYIEVVIDLDESTDSVTRAISLIQDTSTTWKCLKPVTNVIVKKSCLETTKKGATACSTST